MPATIILAEIGITAATIGATAYAAAAFAINFAVSYAVTRIFGAKPPRQQDNGVRQQIPPSSENRIPVAYGEAWMGGTFVDGVLSTDNQAMYYVLAISHISPNGQFTFDTTQFYYGDRLVTFASGTNQVQSLTDGAGNVDTKINGYLYFNLYTSDASGTITTVMGTAPNVAMGGVDIPVSLRWPSSGRQMNGLAFAIIYLKYSTDAGSTGLQPITFKVSHTLNSTGVAKPGSVLLDYLTNTIYGGAVSSANVNTTACAALDTYSDQTIPYTPSGGGSATQARYRINGVLDTGETVLNNVDHILSACDSWISYQAETGQWSPVVNKAESSSFSFDDSNIIGEIRVSAVDITQSVNQIEASFPWKGNKDKPSTVFLQTPSGLLYPNEPVNKYTTNFSMVNDSVQATYLANRVLEQAREDLIVSFNTAYTGIQVNAGDVVSVSNSAYGWTNKLFRAFKVNEASLPDGNLGARIEMNEYNAQVYDDLSITQFTPAPNSSLQSGYYFPALSAPTFSDQAPSVSPPTFSVTCQLPSTVRITTVTLYYTTSATPTQTDWRVWAVQTAPDNNAFGAAAAIKFPNVVIGSSTYYFAFTVGNELSTSNLSTTSAAFTWTTSIPSGPTGPTGASITGPTGANGPTGTAGVSSRICFARVPSNPSPVSGSIVTSGNSSFPSSAQSLSTWGFSATWGASDPNPSSTDSLYQSDGTYDPVTNLTTWTTPYISSLKVGQLSAITTNTGTLTVDTTGYIRGGQTAYNTGTGFFLGYSGAAYKFSIGSTTNSLTWDGSALSIQGNITGSSTLNINGAAEFYGGTTVTSGGKTYFGATYASQIIFQSSADFSAAVIGRSESSAGAGQGVVGVAEGTNGVGVWAVAQGSATLALKATGDANVSGTLTVNGGTVSTASGYIALDATNGVVQSVGGSSVTVTVSGRFSPTADNTTTCGGSGNRWSVVYAATGTINTSDERDKNILGSSLGLAFINALEPVSYKWKIGGVDADGNSRPGVRTFHGLKAQQVKATLDSLGVDDFAGWVLANKDDPNSTQGLRYSEFIAPLIKAVQELSQKVADLEARLK